VWSFDDGVVYELTERLGTALRLAGEPPSRRRDYRGQLTRIDATVSRLLALRQGTTKPWSGRSGCGRT
jgi:hypothetical protein